MRPVVWSKKKNEENGEKWHLSGHDISYYSSKFNRKRQAYYHHFTLSIKYDFQYENDLVYFAYCYPYTFSDLTTYLNEIKDKYPKIMRVNPL